MFVCTVRASTVKFFAFVFATVALMIGLIIIGRQDSVLAMSDSTEIRFDGIKENSDRIAFIESFGVKVKEAPTEEKTFRIPADFDTVASGYNEIQKRQGLDLLRYKNKKVTRYTYEVTNYKEAGRAVYVNMFVYRSKIIAVDMSSGGEDGFVYPLLLIDKSLLK